VPVFQIDLKHFWFSYNVASTGPFLAAYRRSARLNSR
jgi:hypothetical protein